MGDNLLQQYGIFLIGAGLSLALILILFLLLRRHAMKTRGLRPAAAAVHAAQSEEEAQAQDDNLSLSQESAEQADDKTSDDGGFKLFKRKKTKSADKGATDDTAASVRLADIEQEMLAVRELYQSGQISRSVYVAETKALYETARLVKD